MDVKQFDYKAIIQDVAVYLWKSRGELESDLDKHRIQLIDIWNKNNFKYKEYSEIDSSKSIQNWPKFKELFTDIELGLYGVVVVIDIDILSRGMKRQQRKLKELLEKTPSIL